jgi:diguanylate cyclase (GGDEF)-like protein
VDFAAWMAYTDTVPMLVLSVLCQIVAAVAAIRQMPNAGSFRFGWLCLSAALLLMTARRAGPLYDALVHEQKDPGGALLGLTISFLLMVGVLTISRLFRVVHQHEEALELTATRDPLTNLANRRSLIESACEEIRRSSRTGRPMSLLMIDLDHFKHVNDTLGHAHGDAVLVAVASALRSTMRAIDHVGRWGGEEFVVVLPESDSEAAVAAAERVRAAIAALRIAHDGRIASTTVSIGVTTLGSPVGDPDRLFHALVDHGDRALYDAKDDGRNCVREWHGGTVASATA